MICDKESLLLATVIYQSLSQSFQKQSVKTRIWDVFSLPWKGVNQKSKQKSC